MNTYKEYWSNHSRKLRSEWFRNYQGKKENGSLIVVIPYEIHESLYNEQETIKRAMGEIKYYSGVEFTPRTSEKCYLRITKGDGCYFNPRDSCLQSISIGRGCEGYGTILHELLHALGFQHEHQRPDRDKYVRIHSENIKQGINILQQFEKLQLQEYRWNDFDGFDYDSNMMYSSNAFSKNSYATISKTNGAMIPRNEDLSEGDVKKLQSWKEMYGEKDNGWCNTC